jgi:hypothetical protein
MKHKYQYTILLDLTVTEGYQTDKIEAIAQEAASRLADAMQVKVSARLLCAAGDKATKITLPAK